MIYLTTIPKTHVVFHREKKVAFHSRSWGADIDALGCWSGWVHDDGEFTDEEYFVGKGYTWVSNRLEYLQTNATKPELIFSGSSCEAYFADDEEFED